MQQSLDQIVFSVEYRIDHSQKRDMRRMFRLLDVRFRVM
jgi:hypothetical protein